MNFYLELFFRIILIGIGATMMMDFWNLFLSLFGIKSLNFAYLGRWIYYLPKGKWIHENIAKTTQARGELVIGWTAHYSIGISFSALLVFIFGLKWLESPTLLPALFIGIVTILAPFFILQPGLGLGIASSKTPNPNFSRIKSLGSHTVFGLGLYFSALISLKFLW